MTRPSDMLTSRNTPEMQETRTETMVRFPGAAAAAFILLTLCSGGAGHGQHAGPASNFEVIRGLAELIGKEIGAAAGKRGGDTISVSLYPDETAWYVRNEVTRGIRVSVPVVLSAGEAWLSAEIGLADIRVEYNDARSDGLFGGTVVDRRVTITLSTSIIDHRDGSIVFNGDLSESMTDTVAIAHIPALENPNIAVTRGTLPSEGFFSSLAGPLIAIAAVGVAVFLLFHVRS